MPSKASRAASAAQPQPVTNVPKPANPSTLSQKNVQSTPKQAPNTNRQTAETDSKTGDTTESAGEPNTAPTVNRKKQKRREKEAARRATQQDWTNGYTARDQIANGQSAPHTHGRGPTKGYFTEGTNYNHPPQPSYPDVTSPNDDFFSGDEDLDEYDHPVSTHPNSSWLNTSKRKKSKKTSSQPTSNAISRTSTAVSRPNFPTVSNAALRSAHRMGDQLWNPSTQAERENIKQFWLELGEAERRSLVKIEKDAVLKKMKEQQKHSCSCSVCGRKRTAIEEELEVLYDAYYEELEQFANHNPDIASAPQLMAPPTPSVTKGPRQPIPGSFSPRGRVHEIADDEDDLDEDEDYDDEDDEEPYSDEEDDYYHHHGLPPAPSDFLQFGNSLTVKDGILTVADDLLKNDGRHFIDMMEQLAERRMAREEQVHYPSQTLPHQDNYQGHNHAPSDEEDDGYDDEDDEEYDSQDEEDFEGDEMDSMTEEQRMEEGRRMFQIFAARMFEQRVLTAYREKVAAERQEKLLQELEEENRLDSQREAKKAREAAKKKEKKKAQKQAKDEEKARKDAEKAAQEAAIREAEDKKQEEQRLRKEEQRKKREAERKAAEEERLKKEAEKQRRTQEQKERQAETERKQREAKERERQKKEEAKRKEREEREAREKEVREKKAQEAQERKAKEEQARKEKEAATKTEKEARTQHPPRAQPVALPPGLVPPQRGTQFQSPSFPVATPVVPPKVPTPVHNRQSSHPGPRGHSHASSPRSQKTGTELSSASPASVAVPQTPAQTQPNKAQGQPPMLHHPQPSAPRSPLNNPTRNQYAFHINALPGLGLSGPPTNGPGMMPGMMPQMPMFQGPPMGSHSRYGPNGMPFPPNFGGPRSFQPNQVLPFQSQAPPVAPIQPPQNQMPKPPHSRQPSGSTTTESSSQPAPIARPGPIGRPSSTTPDRQKSKKTPDQDVEQLTAALGSKALLDDSDEPIPTSAESRSSYLPVGAPGTGRIPFASTFTDVKQASFGSASQGWGGFGPTAGWGAPGSQGSSNGWPQQPFGSMNGAPQSAPRSHLPRPIAVRVLLAQACRQLSTAGESSHPAQTVLRQLDMMKAPGEPPISMDEMLGICDTEGNGQNGGGYFEVNMDKARGQVIKFTEDIAQPRSGVGDIGSPLPRHSQPSPFPIGQSAFGPPGRGY